ncbi:13495_t:CDS:2 [Gigaspora margarita]|uniref:13495_t:CDS:1 n=1 Tax=Gigaspora margarita TaxID=4874 RepID=A0ABN7VUC6_GIGMA|nr:13495_t:CDS:2 [Gigaspora margarita]
MNDSKFFSTPTKRGSTINIDKINGRIPSNIPLCLFIFLALSKIIFALSTHIVREWFLLCGVPVSVVTFGVLGGAGLMLLAWQNFMGGHKALSSTKVGKPTKFSILLSQGADPSKLKDFDSYENNDISNLIIGYICILCSIWLAGYKRTMRKKLAADVGGNRRLISIAVPLGAVMISPLAFVQHIMYSTNYIVNIKTTIIMFGCLGIGLIILDYFVGHSVSIHASPISHVTTGWPLSIGSAILLGLLWFYGEFSIIDIILCGFMFPGIYNLIASDVRYANETQFPSPGIGNRAFELPLHSSVCSANISIQGFSFLESLGVYIKTIMDNDDSRQIFYFLLLNLSYMVVQIVYGIWTNSLGLISDAIHMFFDCLALAIGLFASIMSKWPENNKFTYGYKRIETLSGFANGIFLILISIFITFEAIGRLIDPPEMSVYLHVLADTFGSVGVLISTLLIQQFGWTGFDPLASILIAGLIFISVIPLIKNSSSVLMLTINDELEYQITEGLHELSHIHGIISYTMPRFWPNDEECLIGSIHVQVTKEVNEQLIIKEVTQVLNSKIKGLEELTIQVEKIEGGFHECLCNPCNSEYRYGGEHFIRQTKRKDY